MSYLLKRGKYWQVNFRINNIEYRFSLKTRNKTRADDLKKKIEYQIDLGLFPDIDNIVHEAGNSANISQFVTLVEDEIKNNASISTSWRRRQIIYLNHFSQFLQNERIRFIHQIRISTMQKYRNWRLSLSSEKTGETISSKTVKDELMFIKSKIFDRAIEDKLITENPVNRALKDTKVDKKERPPFTEEEVELILANATNDFHRDFYTALYYTGSRFGEISHLLWSKVDFKNRQIHIDSRAEYKTKNRKDRVVPIHPKLLQVLLKREKRSDSCYIFPSPQNRSQPIMTLNRGFNKLKRDFSIPNNKTLHSFRHSFASHLQKRGVSIEVIQELLGHSDIRMTRHYQKIDFSVLEEAISKL
ncbi:MAG: tyrosine-type recombinase/integrase [Candidatus Hermodarchaeota archaeon]